MITAKKCKSEIEFNELLESAICAVIKIKLIFSKTISPLLTNVEPRPLLLNLNQQNNRFVQIYYFLAHRNNFLFSFFHSISFVNPLLLPLSFQTQSDLMKIWILSIGNNLERWRNCIHAAGGDERILCLANGNSFMLETCMGSGSLFYFSPKALALEFLCVFINPGKINELINKSETKAKGNESQTSHRPIALHHFNFVTHKNQSSVFALIHSSNCEHPKTSEQRIQIVKDCFCLLKFPVVFNKSFSPPLSCFIVVS